ARTVWARLRAHRPIGLAVVGFVALLAVTGSVATTTRAPAGANPAIEIRIELVRTHVVAGTSIKGEALLTNTTAKVITVATCAEDGWLVLGLTNGQETSMPGFGLVGCSSTIRLAPGVNRFPITVDTTYSECLQPGGSSVFGNVPICVGPGHDDPPALPSGIYLTKVVTVGLPDGTQPPPPLSVTLLPAGS
ncbi:MAG: hypothetical protein WAM97_04320, partial [Acidimicrobiales bacterium]